MLLCLNMFFAVVCCRYTARGLGHGGGQGEGVFPLFVSRYHHLYLGLLNILRSKNLCNCDVIQWGTFLTICTRNTLSGILQRRTKYLRQPPVFMWNSTLWKKFNFYFLRRLLLVLIKLSFWEEDLALGYNLMNFGRFPNVS